MPHTPTEQSPRSEHEDHNSAQSPRPQAGAMNRGVSQHERKVPVPTYFLVFIALMVLLAITASLASVNLGRWNVVVALVVAVCKAGLIVLYFMHVRVGSRLTALFAAAGFAWLGILLVLSMNDYVTRGYLHILGK